MTADEARSRTMAAIRKTLDADPVFDQIREAADRGKFSLAVSRGEDALLGHLLARGYNVTVLTHFKTGEVDGWAISW